MKLCDDRVLCSIDDHIAWIELARPEKLNALTPSMLEALREATDTIDRTDDVRVVVVTGAGERAFSVGADIEAWADLDPATMWKRWIRDGHAVMNAIAGLRQPVIAAVNGFALGGGLELALAADIRICADFAEFGSPEVRVGTVAGWGATSRLPLVIGPSRAANMLLTGTRISAERAEAWGLVTERVPAAELAETAGMLAQGIAANSPVAVQLTKHVLAAGSDSGAAAVLESLAGGFAKTTSDAAEGIASFREKREPRYVDFDE